MATRMVTLNQRKPKKKKDKVIPYSNEDFDYYIHNDIPLPYYDDSNDENEWKFERLLLKGEIAKPVPNIGSGFHFITNYGRILNAKMVRWITVHNVDNRYLIYHLDSKRWYMKKAFKKCGFEYDFKKLIKRYKKIDYPCRKITYTSKSQAIGTQN